MIRFTSNSISIYGFQIYFYGIIMAFAVMAALFLGSKEAKRRGLNVEFLYDAAPWLLFGGIVGARLWHIFTPPPSMVAQGITTQFYLTHPLDALNIRAGGLGIPGAVIGGMIFFYWFARRKQQPFVDWLDALAPAVPLGQAIGRWGNFFNQELYGAPSNLPWAIFIAPENRLPEFADVSHYHPIFFYEALWSLGTVFLLLWLARKFSDQTLPGDIFLVYLITYPTIRILLDFLRLDASEVAGINANQTFMFFVLLAACIVLVVRHRFKKSDNEADMEQGEIA